MAILFILLLMGSIPFGLVAFLLWSWRPDVGRAFLIAGGVAAATSLGVFVVTLGVIDRMHTWDVSMGDDWKSALSALLSVPPVAVAVGVLAYRHLQRRRVRSVSPLR